MKFGKTIRNKALPEWSMHYMDYKALKKIIRKCVAAQDELMAIQHDLKRHKRQGQGSPQQRQEATAGKQDPQLVKSNLEDRKAQAEAAYQEAVTYFFFLLQRQLEKVSDHFSDEVTLLQARIMAISDKFNQMAVDGPLPSEDFRRHTLAQLLHGTKDILTVQHNLHDFSSMNKEGFRKILKKLDKQLGTSHSKSYMEDRVEATSFANSSETLGQLKQRARLIKASLERILGLRNSSSVLMAIQANEADTPRPTTSASASANSADGRPSSSSPTSASSQSSDAPPSESAAAAEARPPPRNLAEMLDHGWLESVDTALRSVDPVQQPAIMDELLVRACQKANTDGIKYCLKHNANSMHRSEPYGYTAWHILVRRNYVDQLQVLISSSNKRLLRRAFAETDSMGQTALHLAAAHNRVDAIDLLVGAGADVDMMATNGITPLLAAIRQRQPEAALCLIDLGADPDLFDSELSSCSCLCLCVCVYVCVFVFVFVFVCVRVLCLRVCASVQMCGCFHSRLCARL